MLLCRLLPAEAPDNISLVQAVVRCAMQLGLCRLVQRSPSFPSIDQVNISAEQFTCGVIELSSKEVAASWPTDVLDLVLEAFQQLPLPDDRLNEIVHVVTHTMKHCLASEALQCQGLRVLLRVLERVDGDDNDNTCGSVLDTMRAHREVRLTRPALHQPGECDRTSKCSCFVCS